MRTNNTLAYWFLIIGIVAIIGWVFKGAWWHMFTGALCLYMFWDNRTEEVEDKDTTEE